MGDREEILGRESRNAKFIQQGKKGEMCRFSAEQVDEVEGEEWKVSSLRLLGYCEKSKRCCQFRFRRRRRRIRDRSRNENVLQHVVASIRLKDH